MPTGPLFFNRLWVPKWYIYSCKGCPDLARSLVLGSQFSSFGSSLFFDALLLVDLVEGTPD